MVPKYFRNRNLLGRRLLLMSYNFLAMIYQFVQWSYQRKFKIKIMLQIESMCHDHESWVMIQDLKKVKCLTPFLLTFAGCRKLWRILWQVVSIQRKYTPSKLKIVKGTVRSCKPETANSCVSTSHLPFGKLVRRRIRNGLDSFPGKTRCWK